jgi:hypothetical protein
MSVDADTMALPLVWRAQHAFKRMYDLLHRKAQGKAL